MKPTKLLLASAILLAVFCVSATSSTTSASDEMLQCGVTNAQITTYLQECSHHHTVYWVQDIVGTCNSKAGIENVGTATVYVSNGIVISHTDSGSISQ
jgi:hypothetical protein